LNSLGLQEKECSNVRGTYPDDEFEEMPQYTKMDESMFRGTQDW